MVVWVYASRTVLILMDHTIAVVTLDISLALMEEIAMVCTEIGFHMLPNYGFHVFGKISTSAHQMEELAPANKCVQI